jgi:ribonuclease E
VIDFIDMRNLKHIQEIEKALKQAVKRDKARMQVSRISQFGLLELSRQRLKPTILEGNYLKCPHCDGSGLVKSTISLALQLLRRIRTEAAKDTLVSVKAVLPMDVANYLLNQKRKEIARLEEEYGLDIHLTGNPAARQNEYEMEFIKREFLSEVFPGPEKGRRKESEDLLTPVLASGSGYGELEVPEETTAMPAVVVESVPALETPVAEPLVVPLAVTRGRVFWRLTATTRRLELAQTVTVAPPLRVSPRTSRTSGRLARRARTWWRRRAVSAPNPEATNRDEAPKISEHLG